MTAVLRFVAFACFRGQNDGETARSQAQPRVEREGVCRSTYLWGMASSLRATYPRTSTGWVPDAVGAGPMGTHA